LRRHAPPSPTPPAATPATPAPPPTALPALGRLVLAPLLASATPPPPPTPTPTPTPPTTSPTPPALVRPVLLVRNRGRGSTLGPHRLRRPRGRQQLDPWFEVRIDLHDADLLDPGRRSDTRPARAAPEPRAARRDAAGRRGGGGAAHEGGRGGRLGHGGIQRLVGVAHGRGLGCGSGHRGGRLLAELHLVRPVALLRQVDDLGVVRLAQQLGEPFDLERLCFAALELDHRLPQLVGAHGLVTATQARQRLFEQTERLTQREATASTPCGSPAAPAFVAPSPPPPPPPPPLPRLPPPRPAPPPPPRPGAGPGHA